MLSLLKFGTRICGCASPGLCIQNSDTEMEKNPLPPFNVTAVAVTAFDRWGCQAEVWMDKHLEAIVACRCN